MRGDIKGEKSARAAMDTRNLAHRAELEMKRVMRGMKLQLAEGASGAARIGTQGTGSGPATGDQRGTAGGSSAATGAGS